MIEEFIAKMGSDSLEVFGGTFEGGIHIQQIPDELAPCIEAIQKLGEVKSYLEIGVAAGGTTYIFNHYFHPEITLVDDNKHHKAKLRNAILDGVKRRELIGRSDGEDVLKAAREQTYDVIVIDGDHLYPAVKKDTENYLPLLNKGGFLIYHDSVMKEWGVYRIVKELKKNKDLKFIGEYVSKKHSPLGIAMFRRVQ
jgi:predicted O-methyltransferase YrrM